MNPDRLAKLLDDVSRGKVPAAQAMKRMRSLPYKDLGFAKVDHHRGLRQGCPEVIFCQGKTPLQVTRIAGELAKNGNNVLATRAEKAHYKNLRGRFPKARYHAAARVIFLNGKAKIPKLGPVCVLTAGSADIPVAEEAALTAEAMGAKVHRLFDVGVAGIHRLLDRVELLQGADALVVVAGMEGALPSVVAGLVDKPIIAVPTSVGYGSHGGGFAALLAMLNSCASGLTVVNIDNGFGAGYSAALISRLARGPKG